MVKCSSIKDLVSTNVRIIYTGKLKEISDKTGESPLAVKKKIGPVDEIIEMLCIAIEMTTEKMGNPGIWLDQYGRLKKDKVAEMIQERYDDYEERMQSKEELDFESRFS